MCICNGSMRWLLLSVRIRARLEKQPKVPGRGRLEPSLKVSMGPEFAGSTLARKEGAVETWRTMSGDKPQPIPVPRVCLEPPRQSPRKNHYGHSSQGAVIAERCSFPSQVRTQSPERSMRTCFLVESELMSSRRKTTSTPDDTSLFTNYNAI